MIMLKQYELWYLCDRVSAIVICEVAVIARAGSGRLSVGNVMSCCVEKVSYRAERNCLQEPYKVTSS